MQNRLWGISSAEDPPRACGPAEDNKKTRALLVARMRCLLLLCLAAMATSWRLYRIHGTRRRTPVFVGILLCMMSAQANAQCSNASTTTIYSPADASSINGCTTFTGGITVATSYAESSLEIDNMTTVGQLLIEDNSNIGTIRMGELFWVGGTLSLSNLSSLASVNFSSLYLVSNYSLNNLPIVSTLDSSFTKSNAGSTFQRLNNCAAELSLPNICANYGHIDRLYITDNSRLSTISFSNLLTVSYELTITNNSGSSNVAFAALNNTGALSISNAANIDFPVLEEVNTLLNISNNPIRDLNLRNLAYVDHDVVIMDNPGLDTLFMPELSYIGGNLNLSSAFNVSLPTPGSVRGSATLDLGDYSNCSAVPASIVQGTWTCAQDSTKSSISTPTPQAPSATSSPSDGLSGGAIAGIVIGAVAGVALIATGVFFFVRRKKSKPQNAVDPARPKEDMSDDGRNEFQQMAEMHSPERGIVNQQDRPAELHSPERGTAKLQRSPRGGPVELHDGRADARHELLGETAVYEVAGDGPER